MMNKRPVGQDLPTKEGHGGLGPEINFVVSLIQCNQNINKTHSNHLSLILIKFSGVRQGQHCPVVLVDGMHFQNP